MTDNTLRKEYDNLKEELGMVYFDYCDEEENNRCAELVHDNKPLPEGVKHASDMDFRFYREVASDMTEAEIKQYLLMKQTSYLKTIKNCTLFFTILTVISVIIWLVMGLKF